MNSHVICKRMFLKVARENKSTKLVYPDVYLLVEQNLKVVSHYYLYVGRVCEKTIHSTTIY